MKEIIVNVPEDAVTFVEELVERIGGQIITSSKKGDKLKKAKPLDFFGTWKDIPLDPQTYRKKLWRKVPEL